MKPSPLSMLSRIRRRNLSENVRVTWPTSTASGFRSIVKEVARLMGTDICLFTIAT